MVVLRIPFLQVFVYYLFQAIRLVAMTLVSTVSTPGHRDDGIHFLSFVLNDLVVLMEYFMGESEFECIDCRHRVSIIIISVKIANFTCSFGGLETC